MIKAQAKLCGVITQNATAHTARDGASFLSFPVRVSVPEAQGGNTEITVSVSIDGAADKKDICYPGKRIEADGLLSFRKVGERLYLNFHAENITEIPGESDILEGTMDFKGTVGKSVDEKTTAKGGKFVTFSAYSSDKVSDSYVFTWVRFINFDGEKPAVLAPKAKVMIKGKLEVSAFKGEVRLACRYESVEAWEFNKNAE